MSERTVTDFRIYNDGNDFSLASRQTAESHTRDEMFQSVDLCRSLVQDGHYFSVDLPEDNSVSARVLLGPMTQEEKDEWIGRISWKLDLSCGELGISSALLMFQDESYDDPYAYRFIKVPPGSYHIDVYSYFPSATFVAQDLLSQLKGGEEFVPVGQWFRETRPGEDYPNWVIWECLESFDGDPDNEEYWAQVQAEMDDEQVETLQEQAGKYVEFLIHLTPFSTEPPFPGFNSIGCLQWTGRLPEKCPYGLYSEEIESDLC